MQSQKITRNVALALIQTFRNTISRPLMATPLSAWVSQLPTSEAVSVSEGCKVYARKRGCVTTYILSGYAADGSDVSAALQKIGA